MDALTRALLVTDVVDSTKLAEELGDARAAAMWAAHDRVARDLLVAHGGREIDKTDGFLLLFEAASSAARYAVAYHRALREQGLAARAGLHVGDVILTVNAPSDVARGAKPLEVDGLAKPVAARVMSVAIGGQTLATADAVAALREADMRVMSHGHWRMKGVAEPIELFEVGDAEGPMTPPPDGAKVYRVVEHHGVWLPVREVKHGLPAERDAFVGRSADLRALAQRLDGGARLVSVLGIGGTGKTRLVQRFAWTWLGDYPGGAWFCDLSEARSVDGVASAVATALDVPLGKDDPVVQLGHTIARRGRCLVVLDNFEQVARHAATTLGKWLDRAPEATFVVTSREVLGLPGEQVLALAPLPGDEALALFVARAAQAKRDFALTAADRPHVEALVELLDGLPLAIELAAARIRVMPPKTLLQRMSERFKLLASAGGRHTRQATLRGALDWSWDLLSADEQAALAQLSVFEGGFALEAAEAVLALDDLWPTDAVQALVDKSLVRQVGDERFDPVRMDLLVTVQEYAAEKLDALGGRADAEARHGGHFATFGTDEALDALDRHGGPALRRALHGEIDNLVAATRRAAARQDGEVATACLHAACVVFALKGPLAVAAALAQEVLELPSLSPRARVGASIRLGQAISVLGRGQEARAHYESALAVTREVGDRRAEGSLLDALGNLNQAQGRMDEARARYEAALAVARELGDRRHEGGLLGSLGLLHMLQGRRDEAQGHFESALAVHREVGNARHEAVVLAFLGSLHQEWGRMDEAWALQETALAAARGVGDRRLEGSLLGNLGTLHKQQGRTTEARAHFDAALALAREVGDLRVEIVVLGCLGILHAEHGRLDEARARFDAALAVHREVGDRPGEGVVLGNLGVLYRDLGRLDESRAHFDAALAVGREVGNRRNEGFVLGNLGVLDHLQGRLDESRARFDAGAEVLRAVGDAAGLVELLCGRARLHRAADRLDQARRDLTEAEAHAATLGAGPETQLGRRLAEARAAVEAP